MGLAFLVTPCLSSGRAVAGSPDSLLAAIDSTESARRAMQAELAGVRARIGRLAREVDSLKQVSPAVQARGPLRKALAEAVVWVSRDEAISQDLIRTTARLSGLRTEAGDAVDRALAAVAEGLSGGLPEAQEAALMARLRSLTEARAALQEQMTGTPELAVQEKVTIYDADGPDEIRQKADLVWDMADQVRREAEAERHRLRGLQMESRLRRRLASFAGEVALFDENLPVVRSVSAGQASGEQGEGLLAGADAAESVERAGDAAAAAPGGVAPAVGPEAAGGAGYQPVDAPGPDGLAAEIASVQARIRALSEQEGDLRAQAEAFRKTLQDMLESTR